MKSILKAKVAVLWVVLSACTAEAASGPPLRFAVSRDEVAAALGAHGLAVASLQVAMLAGIVAVTPHPALDVRSVAPWEDRRVDARRTEDSRIGGRRVKVELTCRVAGECLPFYVLVDWPDQASAVQAVAAFGHRAGGDPIGTSASLSPAATLPVRSADAVALKVGAHATLTIDQGQLHIRVPVVCLEKGPVGRKIRVRSADHKQIYLAEVLDGTSLKGSL